MFMESDLFPPPDEEMETPRPEFEVSRGPNKVSPSPHLKMEKPNFRNVMFSSYLEFRTLDKAPKPVILLSS
jgi:hypothetical protein